MNNRKTGLTITLVMTIAVLGGFATILLMNVAAMLGVVPSRYISPNDVRGMAVEHNQMLYTLNFEQQNELVDIFNHAIPVGKEVAAARSVTPKQTPDIQKIVIYRFSGPDIVITPVSYVIKSQSVTHSAELEQANLVFSVPEWNANGLLEEATSDKIQKILFTTYDP
ncbi:MAG: hypothetical protein WCG42_06640 [Parachlamydiaceae bacterium]